jgi:hypothetical protein
MLMKLDTASQPRLEKGPIARRLWHSSWYPEIRPLGYSLGTMPYFYDGDGGEALLISGRKAV